MTGCFELRILIIALCLGGLANFLGCGASDGGEPHISPSQLSVDSEAGTARQLPLAIVNPTESPRYFTVTGTSQRILVDPSQLTVKAGHREILRVHLFCPQEVTDFSDEIIISESGGPSHRIPIELRCHLASEDGAASLSVTITGLPAGEFADVEISGPDYASLFLTASGEADDLPTGHYTLIAQPVEAAGLQFTPLIAAEDFHLEDGDHRTFHVEYALPITTPTASLRLSTSGISADAEISYKIKGPRAYEASFAFPTHFQDLPPGLYTLELPREIRLHDADETRIWRPDPDQSQFFLFPDQDLHIVIDFQDSLLVTEAEDGLPGSLRHLINEAPPKSVITIADNLDEILLTEGPIVIDRPVTIRATTGSAPITTAGIQGAFTIAHGARVHLEDLHFIDAAAMGEPAIDNHGDLSLKNVEISAGLNHFGPTALRSSGKLIVDGLHLENNTSQRGPGAIHITDGTTWIAGLFAAENQGEFGGAIHSESILMLANAYFALNEASEGAALYNRGTVEMENSAFWLNQGTGDDSFGGALFTEGPTRLTNISFLDNQATFGASVAVAVTGRLDLAHVTFAPNPNVEFSDIFVGPDAHLVARNTLFTGGKPFQTSLDVIPGALLESRGGNILPSPPLAWPDAAPLPGDLLGSLPDDSEIFHSPLEVDGFAQALPLTDRHPGRLFIPGPYCRNTRAEALAIDQLANRRRSDFFCDVGAHQSDTEVHIDTFAPGLQSDNGSDGILSTDAGLDWSFEGAESQQAAILRLKASGSLQTRFDDPICRLSIITRAASVTAAKLAISTSLDGSQARRQTVSGDRWRPLTHALNIASPTLHLTLEQAPIDISAVLWSTQACASPSAGP